MENFTYSQGKLKKVSLFGNSIKELKNRLQGQDDLSRYYEKIIKLMEKVDNKNEVILSDWNEKLISAYKNIE